MRLRIILVTITALFINVSAFAEETLVFAVDIIRHGDRTPHIEIPKANYHWQEGLGQLTPQGTKQMLDLGHTLRERYITQYHLLPINYNSKTLVVFSTFLKRALMSAEAIMQGMYPQTVSKNHQPIPVHIRPRTKETEKKVYKKLLDEFTIAQAKHRNDRDFESQLKKWSKATGLPITSLKQARKLAGSLYIYKLHNIPLPQELSAKDIEQILKIGDEERLAKYKNKKLANFRAQPLLTAIFAYLQNAAKQQSPLRYVLYSDHDSTIASIMTLLGRPLEKSPPYATDLNFLLFKKDHNDYIVKINYNGKQVIPKSCGNQNCSLEQFIKLVNTAE